MRSFPRRWLAFGFTLTVLLVLASIPLQRAMATGSLLHVLSNGRQLFLASFQMAADGESNDDPTLAWPGELMIGPEPVQTVSQFLQRLIEEEYLYPSDVEKITAATGWPRVFRNASQVPGWSPTHPEADKRCALKVYRTRASDSASCLALATTNFSYGKVLDHSKKPFGESAFVVLRKGGAGAACKRGQCFDFDQLGHLPGTTSPSERSLEEPTDTLEQR